MTIEQPVSVVDFYAGAIKKNLEYRSKATNDEDRKKYTQIIVDYQLKLQRHVRLNGLVMADFDEFLKNPNIAPQIPEQTLDQTFTNPAAAQAGPNLFAPPATPQPTVQNLHAVPNQISEMKNHRSADVKNAGIVNKKLVTEMGRLVTLREYNVVLLNDPSVELPPLERAIVEETIEYLEKLYLNFHLKKELLEKNPHNYIKSDNAALKVHLNQILRLRLMFKDSRLRRLEKKSTKLIEKKERLIVDQHYSMSISNAIKRRKVHKLDIKIKMNKYKQGKIQTKQRRLVDVKSEREMKKYRKEIVALEVIARPIETRRTRICQNHDRKVKLEEHIQLLTQKKGNLFLSGSPIYEIRAVTEAIHQAKDDTKKATADKDRDLKAVKHDIRKYDKNPSNFRVKVEAYKKLRDIQLRGYVTYSQMVRGNQSPSMVR